MEKARTAKYAVKEKVMAESGEAKWGSRTMDQRAGTANTVARTGCGVLGSRVLKM